MNYGHGHVFPRQDGKTFPCGGPSKCAQCTADERDQLKELCEDINEISRELAESLGNQYCVFCKGRIKDPKRHPEIECECDAPRAILKKYQDATA